MELKNKFGSSFEFVEYNNMNHGYVSRGDLSDDEVKKAFEETME